MLTEPQKAQRQMFKLELKKLMKKFDVIVAHSWEPFGEDEYWFSGEPNKQGYGWGVNLEELVEE